MAVVLAQVQPAVDKQCEAAGLEQAVESALDEEQIAVPAADRLAAEPELAVVQLLELQVVPSEV